MDRAPMHHDPHHRLSQEDADRRRMLFKVTVGAAVSVFVIGWFMLMKHTLRDDFSPRTSAGNESRAQIMASIKQMQEEFKHMPSFTELVNQYTVQTATPEDVFSGLASRIAGQATSTATSTPLSTPPTSTSEVLP